MEHINFTDCKADPDVWMQKGIKDNDKSPYWEFVLLYMDDALCISMDSKSVLEKKIGKYLTLKSGSLGPPSIYLENKVSKVTLENRVTTCLFSSSQYIQNLIKNVRYNHENQIRNYHCMHHHRLLRDIDLKQTHLPYYVQLKLLTINQ